MCLAVYCGEMSGILGRKRALGCVEAWVEFQPAFMVADPVYFHLAAAWQQYHQTHAKLRIASKRANLKERKPAVDFRPTPTLF